MDPKPDLNPNVDFYFKRNNKWQVEITKLRMILCSCLLREELKWGVPCYMFQKNNIVLIHVFKEYCAILFFKGALLKDELKILIQQTKNVQAARQIRFTHLQEIKQKESHIKAYILEAIELERSGLKIEFKKPAEYKIVDEFQYKLNEIPSLKTAFYALTPGRQRAYLLYFSAPKQAKTREARIEKWLPNMIIGRGLND